MKKVLVSRRQIVAQVAHWGIQQCSLKLPFEFSAVLLELWDILEDGFADANLGFREFEEKELRIYVEAALGRCRKFRDWNLTYNEKMKGVGVDDPARGSFKGSSRFDKFVEFSEDDFIDLDALIKNVCNSLVRDHDITQGNTKSGE